MIYIQGRLSRQYYCGIEIEGQIGLKFRHPPCLQNQASDFRDLMADLSSVDRTHEQRRVVLKDSQ